MAPFTAQRTKARVLACLAAALAMPAAAALVPAIHDYDGQDPASLPALLSQTGLYDNVASPTRAVTAGIVPFEVNVPLWSDGSAKQRWVALPPGGAKIVPTDTDHYAFPPKTVFVKNFAVDTVYGDSAARILVETRFLIVTKDAYDYPAQYGITYQWDRSQQDARLVPPDSGRDFVHNVRLNGKTVGKPWRYPSGGDCMGCHTQRGVLGFLTPQLNRPAQGNPSLNQMQALVNQGVLTVNPLAGKPAPTFRWAAPGETGETLQHRARSYLAANCSQCHGNNNFPQGADHSFDYWDPARSILHPAPRSYVDKPTSEDPAYPRVIYSGWPESTFVLKRMLARGKLGEFFPLAMPILATYQPDSAAVRLIKDWVCSLGNRGAACALPPGQPDTSYWTQPAAVSVLPHGLTPQVSLRAEIRGGLLKVALRGMQAAVSLSDVRGRRVALRPLGGGVYRLPEGTRPGIYLLRAGGAAVRVHCLP